jgi:hypothetical protein
MRLIAIAFVLIILVSCHYGQGAPKTSCKLQELAIEAALGDPQAQHNLGVEFHRGADIAQDFGKAAAMWRRSSEGGIVESFNNLGYLTYYGKGIQQDYAEGVRLWRIAAEKGFPESQVHLAEAYSDGRHLKRDYSEAYAWAKTGRHYAGQMEDAGLGKSIAEMADTVLADASKILSKPQLTEAEKKATEYIAKSRPK